MDRTQIYPVYPMQNKYRFLGGNIVQGDTFFSNKFNGLFSNEKTNTT